MGFTSSLLMGLISALALHIYLTNGIKLYIFILIFLILVILKGMIDLIKTASNNNEFDAKNKIAKWGATLLLFVSIIMILLDIYLNLNYNTNITLFKFDGENSSNLWAIRGQWGDMLSGHFSILAFLALIYSIYLQRIDTKEARQNIFFNKAYDLVKEINEIAQKCQKNKIMIFATTYFWTNFEEIKNTFNSAVQNIDDEAVINELTSSIEELRFELENILMLINTMKALYPNPDRIHSNVLDYRMSINKNIIQNMISIYMFLSKKIYTLTNEDFNIEYTSKTFFDEINTFISNNDQELINSEILNKLYKKHFQIGK